MDGKFLSFQLWLPTYLFILVKEFCSAEDVSRLYFYTRLKSDSRYFNSPQVDDHPVRAVAGKHFYFILKFIYFKASIILQF